MELDAPERLSKTHKTIRAVFLFRAWVPLACLVLAWIGVQQYRSEGFGGIGAGFVFFPVFLLSAIMGLVECALQRRQWRRDFPLWIATVLASSPILWLWFHEGLSG